MLGLLALPARAAEFLPSDDVLEEIDAALEPAFDQDVAEARAEADAEDAQAQAPVPVDPQAAASPEAQPSEEGTESEGPAREPRTSGRRRLERLVRGYSISRSIFLKKEPYSVSIKLRYSRSVEFDYHLESYILIEGFEITPGVEFRDQKIVDKHSIGPYLILNRPWQIIVRRAGFPRWKTAFFAPLYHLKRLPTKPDKALLMKPGESVSMNVGVGLFLGPRAFNFTGDAHSSLGIGVALPAEYYVRVERLTDPDVPGEEWVLSVGGTLRRYFELSAGLRSPKVLIKRFRLLDFDYKGLSRGLQFSFFSPALDLRRTPSIEPIYEAVMKGTTHFPEVKLWGQTYRLFLHPEITMETMSRMQELAEFRHLLEPAQSAAGNIVWSRALTGTRGHESDVRFWILLYRTTWNFDSYDGETLLDTRSEAPLKSFQYLTRRSRNRSWIFFPREGYDLEVVTLQDYQTGRLVTEATLQIEDRHAGVHEGQKYRRTVRRFLGTRMMTRFPMEPPPRPQGPVHPGALEYDGLPDLSIPPSHKEKVSFALRVVLGTRFHGGALGEGEPFDPTDRKHRTVHGRSVHTKVYEAVFGVRPGMDDLFGQHGLEDAYESFYMEFKTIPKRGEAPIPTRIYRGSTGNPARDVVGYARLRRAFDAATAQF